MSKDKPSESYPVAASAGRAPRGGNPLTTPGVEARSRLLGKADRLAVRAPGYWTRSFVVLLLRLTLGAVFLVGGYAKFDVSDKFADQQVSDFAGTWPVKYKLVRPLTMHLPIVVMVVGAFLVAGLFTYLAALAAGALLVLVSAGQAVLVFGGKSDAIQTAALGLMPLTLIFLGLACAVLWLHATNFVAIDGLLFGWWTAPPREEPGAVRH